MPVTQFVLKKGSQNVGLFHVAKDTDQWKAHANTLTALHFPRKRGGFLECMGECLLLKRDYAS